MIELAVEEKNGNYICCALHKETNHLEKQSSETVEKGLSICFSRIDDALFRKRFLTVYWQKGIPMKLIVNGVYEYRLKDLKDADIEAFIDKAEIGINSLHGFDYSNYKCFSYELGNQNIQKLHEVLLKSSKTLIDSK